MTSHEVMVCHDCLHVAHYGNEHWDVMIYELGERAGTKRYEEVSNSLDALGDSTCGGDYENTEEFSWNPCECCGSTLGGSRHELVVMDYDE